jgi:hypothetical protein
MELVLPIRCTWSEVFKSDRTWEHNAILLQVLGYLRAMLRIILVTKIYSNIGTRSL